MGSDVGSPINVSIEDLVAAEEGLVQDSPEPLGNQGGDLNALFYEEQFLSSDTEELSNRTALPHSEIPAHLRSIVKECSGFCKTFASLKICS